jgi:hypothetical protein
MCGCGNTATSGPVGAVMHLAMPRDAEPREFADKATADAYVAAFGGGSVISKQPATADK